MTDCCDIKITGVITETTGEVDGEIISPSQIFVDDGSESAPSIAFTNDTDTGIFNDGGGRLGISSSGSVSATFGVNNITIARDQIRSEDGSESVPMYSFTNDTDTGLYRSKQNGICITAGSSCITQFSPTGLELKTGQHLVPSGLVTAPTYSFTDDPDTGVYLIGDGDVGISTGGVLRLQVKNTCNISKSRLCIPLGVVSNLALKFENDQDTGIYRPDTNQFAIVTAGVERLLCTNTQLISSEPILVPLGSVTEPSYTFNGDTNTGIWSVGDANINFSSDGEQKMNIRPSEVSIETNIRHSAVGVTTAIDYTFEDDSGMTILKIDFTAAAKTLTLETPVNLGRKIYIATGINAHNDTATIEISSGGSFAFRGSYATSHNLAANTLYTAVVAGPNWFVA